MDSTEQSTLIPDQTRSIVHETYVNALHHDNAEIPANAAPVGVVNIKMYGITSVTDVNYPALAPPDELFNDFRAMKEELEENNSSDKTTTHNEAWERVEFTTRYEQYLENEYENTSSDVRAACEDIMKKSRENPIAVVCYEGKDKNCHRHILQSFLNTHMSHETHE